MKLRTGTTSWQVTGTVSYRPPMYRANDGAEIRTGPGMWSGDAGD